MRVLKIGRSSSNDIMLNDPTVSSQHGIITILDTGEVQVRDLNSKNGTYVNEQRIDKETIITSKDIVKAGNSIVYWQKKLQDPKPVRQFPAIIDNSSNIKDKKTIGRNVSNDIVFDHRSISGTHAQLIQNNNGDIMIADSGSTNGTYVNGQKISVQVLKAGDTVLLANKYFFDWSSVFSEIASDVQPKEKKSKPSSSVFSEIASDVQPKEKKIKTIGILLAATTIVSILSIVVGCLFLFNFGSISSPEKIFAQYKKSVVFILGAYYFQTSIRDTILHDYSLDKHGNIIKMDSKKDSISYTATGFFVSKDGNIITNRYATKPWEYNEDIILKISDYEKRVLANSKYRSMLNELKVEGQLATIKCLLNDSYVSSMQQDYIPCTPIKAGSTKDLDVALIQVNSKSLPNGVNEIIDLKKAIVRDNAYVVGAPIYTIGFPTDLRLSLTDEGGLEANNYDGKITQIRGDIEFGHNIETSGGLNGSPVFNKNGRLIGIMSTVLESKQGYNMAIKAKHALDLLK